MECALGARAEPGERAQLCSRGVLGLVARVCGLGRPSVRPRRPVATRCVWLSGTGKKDDVIATTSARDPFSVALLLYNTMNHAHNAPRPTSWRASSSDLPRRSHGETRAASAATNDKTACYPLTATCALSLVIGSLDARVLEDLLEVGLAQLLAQVVHELHARAQAPSMDA